MKFGSTLGPWSKDFYERLKQIRMLPSRGSRSVTFRISGDPLALWPENMLSILSAWMTRLQQLSAAVAVSFHDILTPIRQLSSR